jgi:putative nucleotidyltransferase with HDIG domain
MVNGAIQISLESITPLAGHFSPEKVNAFYALCRQLVSTNTLDVLLDNIVAQTVDILHVKFSRILTIDAEGSFIWQASHSSGRLNGFDKRGRRENQQAQVFYQHVLLSGEPVYIARGSCLARDLRQSLNLKQTESLVLIPLHVNQESIGILIFGEESRFSLETLFSEKIRLAVLIADQAAAAIYRARLSDRLEESQLQTVMALSKAIEARDAYVAAHSRKVTVLAVRLARRLGLSAAEERSIRWAAMLHDIGKVGIPDTILSKKGPLDREEWGVIRQHPESGAEIVRMASNLNYVAALIQAHHERYDGSGYPYGLRGDLIPFGARVLAVADAFSAMTDDRVYRPSLSREEAAAEIQKLSGIEYDSKVVDALMNLL